MTDTPHLRNPDALNAEALQVSEELLERYNRPGPRYTSYPTAPVWVNNFGIEDFDGVCRAADSEGRPVSLYQHLPFCESLCLFCACNVVISKDKTGAAAYLDTLEREVDEVARRVSRSRPVIQFHWGGGTPTYYSPAQLEELFGFTRERFTFSPDAEIGVEVDPRVTSREHLETLRRLGFNRLSMGVQDFTPEVQKAVHRIQGYELTRDLVLSARRLGFDSINVDLIYGLPLQTAESFGRTVEQIIEIGPDRIAMFSYAHVPWLKKQQGSFATRLPEGMEKFRIFRRGLELFLAAGFEYIGMDHFARPADELALAQRNRTLHRNFQGYTTKAGADLYGMGVSAISGIGDAYAQNERDAGRYAGAVSARGLATMRGYRLTADDLIRRSVISRLLCHTVVHKDEIEREFGLRFDQYFAPEMDRLAAVAADGLVRLSPNTIAVIGLGRIFIRNVAMIFDPYLEQQRLAERPLFSKTL